MVDSNASEMRGGGAVKVQFPDFGVLQVGNLNNHVMNCQEVFSALGRTLV
jgi:hypothetical protein